MSETNKLEMLKDALGRLDPREREILEARYGLLGEDPKTLNEIGQALNLSRERVRQLEARALQTLRRTAISLGLADDGRSRRVGSKRQDGISRLDVLSMALNGRHKGSNLKILKIPKKKNGEKNE